MCYNVKLTHSSICIIGNSAERIKESARSGTKVITERFLLNEFNYETYGKHFDYLDILTYLLTYLLTYSMVQSAS